MRISDWSSDVCSSDLLADPAHLPRPPDAAGRGRWAGDSRARSVRVGRDSVGPAGLSFGTLGASGLPGGSRRDGLRSPWQPTRRGRRHQRSEEHTYELQSLMLISYAVFCLKKKKKKTEKEEEHSIEQSR